MDNRDLIMNKCETNINNKLEMRTIPLSKPRGRGVLFKNIQDKEKLRN